MREAQHDHGQHAEGRPAEGKHRTSEPQKGWGPGRIDDAFLNRAVKKENVKVCRLTMSGRLWTELRTDSVGCG